LGKPYGINCDGVGVIVPSPQNKDEERGCVKTFGLIPK